MLYYRREFCIAGENPLLQEGIFTTDVNSVLHKRRVCTTSKNSVLQKTILYYRRELCITKENNVLQNTIMYYRRGFCTTEENAVLWKRILYYIRESCTTEENSAIQKGNMYYRRECWVYVNSQYEHWDDDEWWRRNVWAMGDDGYVWIPNRNNGMMMSDGVGTFGRWGGDGYVWILRCCNLMLQWSS